MFIFIQVRSHLRCFLEKIKVLLKVTEINKDIDF